MPHRAAARRWRGDSTAWVHANNSFRDAKPFAEAGRSESRQCRVMALNAVETIRPLFTVSLRIFREISKNYEF
jgi:hypothetical protein